MNIKNKQIKTIKKKKKKVKKNKVGLYFHHL